MVQYDKSEIHFSFVKSTLNGISQVMLIKHWVTGLIILIAITLTSFVLGMITAISALVGTIVGYYGGADRNLVYQGLFGYNAVLTGIGLMVFMQGSNSWVYALTGALISSILTAAMVDWFKRNHLPVLTFPFVVVTWTILLSSYQLNSVRTVLNPQTISSIFVTFNGFPHLEGWIRGIGQVFIVENFWTGVMILLGVLVAGWKPCIYALLGSGISFITAYFLNADTDWISIGLYGYNGVLTMLAIAYVFESNQKISFIAGLIASSLSVFVMAGISVFTHPFGLPAFTMPFTLTTWTFLGAFKTLRRL